MTRRPYHPPALCRWDRPESATPVYIGGDTGVQGFGSHDFFVAQIPQGEAREVIINNHYSRRVVNNSYIHLGVYLHGALQGVLQFGYALNPHRASRIVADTAAGQYLELNRMWLSDVAPRNSESRAISYAVKYIRRASAGVRWIQSFADDRCKRCGVVYQASNFLYLGSHKTKFYLLDGETYHEMLLTARKKGGLRGVFLRDNLSRATLMQCTQYRYIYFLQPRFKKDLNFKVLPYPKPMQEQSGMTDDGPSACRGGIESLAIARYDDPRLADQ